MLKKLVESLCLKGLLEDRFNLLNLHLPRHLGCLVIEVPLEVDRVVES